MTTIKNELILKFVENPEEMRKTKFPEGLTVLSKHNKSKFNKIDYINLSIGYRNGRINLKVEQKKIFLCDGKESYLLSENIEDFEDIKIFIDGFVSDIEDSIKTVAEIAINKALKEDREFIKYLIKCQFDEDFDNFKKHLIKNGGFLQESNHYLNNEDKFHFINEKFFFKQIQSKNKNKQTGNDEIDIYYKGVHFNFYFTSVSANLI